MKKDCRNDCTDPFDFPKTIDNRPALPHIGYRIGGYSDFLEAMLRKLNRNDVLKTWTHREPDDPGITLLEGAAIIGDILTFYQEHYANEAYLRTANWRESIADLVRLLGYRLSPGVGGKATFVFEVKGDKPVVIPKGFPVKAQLKPLEQAAEFETLNETAAHPELSKFSLYRPSYFPPFSADVSIFSAETAQFEQAGLDIAEKDRLMLLDTLTQPTNNTQIVVVKKVEKQFDQTNITIEGTWANGSGLSKVFAFNLARTFRHFGHNAPSQVIKFGTGGTPSQHNITYERKLHESTATVSSTTIAPSFTARQIPLDNQVADLLVGNALILEDIAYHRATLVRYIESFKSASMTWGALTGATTLVTLNESFDDERFGHTHSTTDIRQLAIHETVGNALTLKTKRQANPGADGSSLFFFGSLETYRYLDERRLAFLKAEGGEAEYRVTINKASGIAQPGTRFRPIYLDPPLDDPFTLADFPFEEPTVTVYGNLVSANQGKTEKEAVLGNGDNRQAFQTFKLSKAPLTYHLSVGETPPDVPELEVWANDRLWTRVPTFFNHGSDEEIYIVREDDNGESWVQFGDGKTGRRLPSGVGNVKATYRSGVGAHGPLKEETTVQAGSRLAQLDRIQLPGVVSGGAETESGDNAREAAPGKVQSLDRLVSLQDFESETLAIPGVTKVLAVWGLVENVPSVVLTVLMETGREQEIEAVRQILNGYNRCRGPQRFPIEVVQGRLEYVCLSANVAYDPTYRQDHVGRAIREALGIAGAEGEGHDGSRGLFALKQRYFGQHEYATRVTGIIQNVEGVLWTKLTGLASLGEADDPAELAVPATKLRKPALACDNQHVFSLFKSHLTLSPVAAPLAEVC